MLQWGALCVSKAGKTLVSLLMNSECKCFFKQLKFSNSRMLFPRFVSAGSTGSISTNSLL